METGKSSHVLKSLSEPKRQTAPFLPPAFPFQESLARLPHVGVLTPTHLC